VATKCELLASSSSSVLRPAWRRGRALRRAFSVRPRVRHSLGGYGPLTAATAATVPRLLKSRYPSSVKLIDDDMQFRKMTGGFVVREIVNVRHRRGSLRP